MGGAGINGLQQYQPQARGNIGPPFGDTPRAAYGQRSAAPPVPVASDEGYNGHYRTEIDDDTSRHVPWCLARWRVRQGGEVGAGGSAVGGGAAVV